MIATIDTDTLAADLEEAEIAEHTGALLGNFITRIRRGLAKLRGLLRH